MGKSNILLIGNGFDLAHGLPTRYSDFLEYYIQMNSDKFGERLLHNDPLPKELEFLSEVIKKGNGVPLMMDDGTSKFLKYTRNNIWMDYFVELYIRKLSGENWIDFEKEISFIIQSLDNEKYHLQEKISEYLFDRRLHGIYGEKIALFSTIIGKVIPQTKNKHISNISDFTFRAFREILFEELQNLICGLEIYLCQKVETLDLIPIELIQNIDPLYVISFNYTHTADRMFVGTVVTYIHGECSGSSTIETNDMVIGIDEYGTNANAYTDYAIFKKYVQRIRKQTDKSKLKHKVPSTLSSDEIKKYTLHIYGHSLDVTDKDILNDILTASDVKQIIIYCMDKSSEGQYIANLVNIIGKQEVVSKYNSGALKFQLIIKDGD